jgi:hypothetical protein
VGDRAIPKASLVRNEQHASDVPHSLVSEVNLKLSTVLDTNSWRTSIPYYLVHKNLVSLGYIQGGLIGPFSVVLTFLPPSLPQPSSLAELANH